MRGMPGIHGIFGIGRICGPMACGGFAALLCVAGCSTDMSREFGFTRDTPDEFTVTTRAPLSMPPDYSLRPPQPGASRPQEMSAQRAAEAALVPQAAIQSGTTSAATPGEQALVAAAGAPAPADIRREVDADAVSDTGKRGFTDYVMFWRKPPPAPGVAVDPAKEAERLRANAALGQNVNQGETPIIQEKPKSIMQRWFGWL